MDVIIEERFQRVEIALNTLIDSITTYNPSVQAAADLVAADDEFSKGLEQLAQHQANYARILKLRHTTEALDSQIKSTVSLLADTRKELLAIPSASEPDVPIRDVPFDELLAFAKNIAKFTVPPTYRPGLPTSQDEIKTIESRAATEPPADVSMTNGGSAHSPSQPQTQLSPSQTADKDGEDTETKDSGTAFTQLTPQQKALMEDMSRVPFMPWPDHDLIRRGNLQEIQDLIKKGVDPATILSKEEMEAQEEEKRAQSEERKVEEQKRKEARRQADVLRHSGQGDAAPSQAKPAFGGFSLYDPDEEDMDEDE